MWFEAAPVEQRGPKVSAGIAVFLAYFHRAGAQEEIC